MSKIEKAYEKDHFLLLHNVLLQIHQFGTNGCISIVF